MIIASIMEPTLMTKAPPTIGSAVLTMMPSVSLCRLASTELRRYSSGMPSPPILYLSMRNRKEQKLASVMPQILPATEKARIVFSASM